MDRSAFDGEAFDYDAAKIAEHTWPANANVSVLDFPLRGAVVCGHCSTPLTACWSKGRMSYHPYYLCRQRGCEAYGKSIRREK